MPVLANKNASSVFLQRAHASLTYALQPVVNIHTGGVYGYEALLRGITTLGFPDASSLLTAAWEQHCAVELDLMLRERALAQFVQLPNAARYRLFFNLDPRLLVCEQPEPTLALLRRYGLAPEVLCFDLSERADTTANPQIAATIAAYRRLRVQFAIDDFGSGCSGLRLLYEHPPELLKIDRFFISGSATDHRKRLFVANAVQLAHVMGISVIAEGVETEAELIACREAGCDLVQGFFVAHPQLTLDELRVSYEHVNAVHQKDRREPHTDLALIAERMEYIPPLFVTAHLKSLFEAFRHHKALTIIPLLDSAERPLGLIHEADIKEHIYSTYGRDLILNPAFRRTLLDFARPCPSVDRHASVERILEAFSANVNPAGIIVTQDARYVGFISAMALLQLIEQKNIAVARDQNPLTKLPGNIPIHNYVSRQLEAHAVLRHFVYFDFDYFKAFNDHYGFRLGDRAILMFAELLRKELSSDNWFVGHIGGDDFFAGIQEADSAQVLPQIQHVLSKFSTDVQSLYDPEDRQRGFIRARDRFGEERDMPLMRCSAALLAISSSDRYGGVEELGRVIAQMKHQAKASVSGLVFRQDLSTT
jgi:diguanylate cyclase (GGDEF)-like protein